MIKSKINGIIIISFLLIIICTQNRTISRYYKNLDVIKVRFTINDDNSTNSINNTKNNNKENIKKSKIEIKV